MRKYTQYVIAAARQQPGDVSEVQKYAAWTLIQYFALARGWPPRSPAWTEALASKWWDDAGPSMYRTVQTAWAHPGMRAHIRQLAALNELSWELYPSDESDQRRRDFIVGVANDLGVWKAWPGLHDVRNLLPLPAAVMRDLQAAQLFDPNQGTHSAGSSFRYLQGLSPEPKPRTGYWNKRP
jgi:hypothetical protein